MMRGPRGLAAVACVVAAITMSGCSDETAPGGDTSEGECTGQESASITVIESGDTPLPGGGSAGIGTVEEEHDPPLLNLILGDATEAERDSAIELEAGDTFTLKDKTYTVAGFCEDKAWLNEAG
ncbi:MAG: hypothetical protein L0K86_20580 [Actinomycetia bacterium]|nr:hypothetical protein [Actinomycetes bacterium]